jgi:hypothetical protein
LVKVLDQVIKEGKATIAADDKRNDLSNW